MIGHRHAIDRVEIERGDHALRRHVAELADLAALVVRDRMAGAAQQDVRLDADRAQFLHRMLRRLGLQFAGRLDIGHQRQMHEGGLAARQVVVQLADGFEERQAFDVADRAADLDEEEIEVLHAGHDEFLDHVGDVRDHLHGAAEIAAPAFALDHLAVDATGGDVVGLRGGHAGEPLVVSQIEIGLRPVIGDVDFAMLERGHRSRIDVEIGIEFPQTDFVPASLQQSSECGGRKTFSEGRDHAAGDEDQPRHGSPLWRTRRGHSSAKIQFRNCHGGLTCRTRIRPAFAPPPHAASAAPELPEFDPWARRVRAPERSGSRRAKPYPGWISRPGRAAPED